MEDLYQKRLRIERGELTTWARRGAGAAMPFSMLACKMLLQFGLRVTGLQARGERNACNAVVNSLQFEFEALPAAFCGFTILHLSDIHIDGLPQLADQICARLSNVEVDICVMTGDYRFRVYGPCDNVYPGMAQLLKHINARHGILGVLGNHDVAEKVPELERMGVKMLMNRAHEVRQGSDSMWIAGVDDPHYYGCDDLPGALRDVPAEAFKILLVHTPEMVTDAADHGINLYLCGHTHGGQICLPLIGPVVSGTKGPRKYIRGAWRHQEMHGYTSAGVGASIVPVRFGCPPEIGLIELRCAGPCSHRDASGKNVLALQQ